MARLKTVAGTKGFRASKDLTQGQKEALLYQTKVKIEIFNAGLIEGAKFMREKILNAAAHLEYEVKVPDTVDKGVFQSVNLVDLVPSEEELVVVADRVKPVVDLSGPVVVEVPVEPA